MVFNNNSSRRLLFVYFRASKKGQSGKYEINQDPVKKTGYYDVQPNSVENKTYSDDM